MKQAFRLAALMGVVAVFSMVAACHKSTDDALSSSNASNTNKPYVVDESASATKNQFDTGTPVIPPSASASGGASGAADSLGTKP